MRRAIVFSSLLAVAGGVTLALADAPDGGSTAVSVLVADGGDTRIEVSRGVLRVRAGGTGPCPEGKAGCEQFQLRAGEGARVKRGGKVKRISLLPAPAPLAPADGDHLNTIDVPLRWNAVAGASSYHVLVATDAAWTHPVFEAAHATSARVSARLASAGVYYWRVSANAGELEGSVSPTRRFVVDVTPPVLKTGKPKWR